MIRESRPTALTFAVLLCAAALLAGCSGTGETTGTTGSEPPPPPKTSELLADHEASFDPSAHGKEELSGPPDSVTITEPDTPLPPPVSSDSAHGFRVQVLITQEFDEAQKAKEKISTALPGEPVYVVHHAPYYKVRAGNFFTRQEAAVLAASLKRSGFKDSWVVPDRIVRNPAESPPANEPEQPRH